MDPFGVTCDPAAYVPRPATEAVLTRLAGALTSGRRLCTLSGPPGFGKTLLLRVLEERLARKAECVGLPYAALGVDDLARWVLGLLGRDPTAPVDPVAALVAHARQGARLGRPLVLLLDDASALPIDAARRWAALCAEARGALRLVVVPVDDGRAGRVVGALGDDVVRTRLTTPMSLDETRSYVRGRLDYADASQGLRERFDEELVARLHREGGGNPRRVHGLATWILHRDGLATDAGPPSPEEGSWLDPDAAAAWPMEGPAGLEIDEIEAALREPDPPAEGDLSVVGSVDNPTPGG